MAMPLNSFCFGTVCGAIIFAVAIDTTIYCHLGRRYGPLFRLFSLDVYEKNKPACFENTARKNVASGFNCSSIEL
jgi:hypothetical protein